MRESHQRSNIYPLKHYNSNKYKTIGKKIVQITLVWRSCNTWVWLPLRKTEVLALGQKRF